MSKFIRFSRIYKKIPLEKPSKSKTVKTAFCIKIKNPNNVYYIYGMKEEALLIYLIKPFFIKKIKNLNNVYYIYGMKEKALLIIFIIAQYS